VLVLTALAVAVKLWDPLPIEQLRLFAFDTYQRLAPREWSPDLPVRIVDIDDAALAKYGQWPWPRNRLADLVDKMNAAGAAAIGFDFVFSEADRTSPEQLLANLPEGRGLDTLTEYLGGLTPHDEIFGTALAGGNGVLGVLLNQSGQGPEHEPRASFAHSGDDPLQFVFQFSGVAGNVESIEVAAKGLGTLNWVPDADQIVRRVPLIARIDDRLYPTLAAELLRVAQGASTYLIKSSGASGEEAFGASTGVVAARVGSLEVPTTPQGEVWVRYAGSHKERYIPAGDIIEGLVDPDQLAGRIVLVGTSASGLFDLRATPLNSALPGVEVHAELAEQMVLGEHLIRPDFAEVAEAAYLVVLGLMMALLISRIGPQWTGVVALIAMVGANGLSWFAFTERGWLVDPVYPTAMGAAVYVAGTLAGYLRSEAERDQVRNAFGRYLAPALVEQLAADPSRLRLGGEMRDVTVLFLDIRGFTSISERMDATELTQFINRFLTPMTDEILAHGGTIDKYMGDAIMAFWNAPIEEAEHAAMGCDAALAMVRRLAVFNTELVPADGGPRELPEVRIGIGLNTGPCCVGNLGSEQRFAYSAIGDDVNVASRLEGQTKTYGVAIIIGEATAAGAPDHALIEIDLLRVQGKQLPVRIFALMGSPDYAAAPEFVDLKLRHQAMLEAYRGRRWAEALRQIEACEQAQDGRLQTVYGLYRERIAHYRRHPPPKDWDGVAVALGK
jgi:adenylate cyclase